MTTTFLKKAFAAALIGGACLTGVAMASGSGTQFGKVQFTNSAAPAKDDLSFIAFINGKDDIIHTENAYNCALGLGNGYVVQNNEGYWLVNFSNFSVAEAGQPFQVQFTSRSTHERAEIAGTIPPGLTQTSNAVVLASAVAPRTPSNLRAQRSADGVQVSWATEPNVSYRLYRADLPSGADNGFSRGIYDKVAEGLTGSFVDTNTEANKTYWYLVVAENKNGVLSGHSEEVRALPANQIAEKPALVQPARSLNPSGASRLQGN